MVYFYPKQKMYRLKIYRGVFCVMTIKNDAKSEPTCHFKIGMTNLRIFDPSILKSEKYAL